MSIQYCHKCGKTIDTDFNAEHFADEVDGCEDTFEEDETGLKKYLKALKKLNKALKNFTWLEIK